MFFSSFTFFAKSKNWKRNPREKKSQNEFDSFLLSFLLFLAFRQRTVNKLFLKSLMEITSRGGEEKGSGAKWKMCSRNKRKNVTGFIDQNATNVGVVLFIFSGQFSCFFFPLRILSSFLFFLFRREISFQKWRQQW